MKQAAAIIKDIKERGYIEHKGIFYPPSQAAALALGMKKRKKRTPVKNTGWTDDTRNIKNKESRRDAFMMLIEKELHLEVWPEFFFSTERLYRIDYAIPVAADLTRLKIAIEVNGGVWSKGNSGHSSGKGILRDYEKANLLQSIGWRLITVTPSQLLTSQVIDLIKSFM